MKTWMKTIPQLSQTKFTTRPKPRPVLHKLGPCQYGSSLAALWVTVRRRKALATYAPALWVQDTRIQALCHRSLCLMPTRSRSAHQSDLLIFLCPSLQDLFRSLMTDELCLHQSWSPSAPPCQLETFVSLPASCPCLIVSYGCPHPRGQEKLCESLEVPVRGLLLQLLSLPPKLMPGCGLFRSSRVCPWWSGWRYTTQALEGPNLSVPVFQVQLQQKTVVSSLPSFQLLPHLLQHRSNPTPLATVSPTFRCAVHKPRKKR